MIDVAFDKRMVIVHSVSGNVITPHAHITGSGTEMRLWHTGTPNEHGSNYSAAGDHLGRIWSFEPAQNGVRIRNHLTKAMYLTVDDAKENTTLKMRTRQDHERGQVWHLERALPGLNDFLLVPSHDNGLAIGPMEGAHELETVLILRPRTTLNQLWTAQALCPARTADDL
ncbi:RICIN domain-containing protein [Streptomyces sp. NPDC057002]|uniref:RICIN domain-containing protein n=1 Tax=Streptomyces sp. NPDC057002 TaxID=3345992 RepID=UPI00363E6A2E